MHAGNRRFVACQIAYFCFGAAFSRLVIFMTHGMPVPGFIGTNYLIACANKLLTSVAPS